MLAVAGAPGAGKSTVCERLLADAAARGVPCAVVPMDGWHLAHSTLERLGMALVKGAPHTFDAAGFVALVRRLRTQQVDDPTIWAPEFRREIEDAVAGAVEVRGDHRLVIVEGNYLLLDESPWNELASLFDSAWMLRPDERLRQERLMTRHERYGRSAEAAREHTLGSDEANARRVRGASTAPGLQVTVVDPG